MSTLIIGANGQIGRLLVEQLVKNGDPPKAMVRTQDQAEAMRDLGATPVVGDLEDDFTSALTGCSQIVFTAGSGAKTGPDKTILVDLWGAMKAIDAAVQAGIQHFIMVSSRGAENPEKGPAKIKHYTVCKKLADDHLLRSGLDYTILRPGRLTNDPATGQFTTDWPANPDDQWITRADVAGAIAYCLNEPRTLGKIYPLFHGSKTLEQALE